MTENKDKENRSLVEVGDYFIDVTGVAITPEAQTAISQAGKSYVAWENVDRLGGNKVEATEQFQSAWSSMIRALNLTNPVILHRNELEVEKPREEKAEDREPVAVG